MQPLLKRLHYVPLAGSVLAAAYDSVGYSILFFGLWVVALIYGLLFEVTK